MENTFIRTDNGNMQKYRYIDFFPEYILGRWYLFCSGWTPQMGNTIYSLAVETVDHDSVSLQRHHAAIPKDTWHSQRKSKIKRDA
jgi:hypothetical protein